MLIPAPPLKNIIPSFIEFIKDSILIGHNVNFDINFLYDACESFGYILDNNFVDNMRIARKLFPEEKHHRLIDVINMLDVSIERSHRADDDVLATLQCHEKMKQIVLSQGTISDFQDKFNKRRKYDSYKASAVSATVSEIDDSNPLFQKTCVFTGTLSFPRKEAWQLVANLGGIPADRITKKTNFLIIGDYDFIKSVKNGKTSKMRKAEEYKSSGLDISTLSESTFLDMVSEYIEIPQIKPKKINNIDDIVD